MICIKCDDYNTECIDDMLQNNYIAEIYKCNDCNGTIEIEYLNDSMSFDNIKMYRYRHS